MKINKNKILLVNKFFYLNGGSERVFFLEREFLISHGFDIIDFSMKDSKNLNSNFANFFIDKVDYTNTKGIIRKLKTGFAFIHSSESVNKITKIIKHEKPNIAHLHNIYHQLTPSIIPILKENKIKVILTLHDGKLCCPSYLMLNRGKPCLKCAGTHFHYPITTNCQQTLARGILLSLEAYFHAWKKSYDGVDAFIVPSIFLGNIVAPRIGHSKTHLIRNGIDQTKFIPSTKDDGYLLYVGRLSSEKGIDTLLKAHSCMNNISKLVIVGTGPLEYKLRSHASSSVIFKGYCTGENLWELVKKSSCLIVPSEWYENAPMTILEGMAFAKPIIASRIGGIPEQVVHGETGILFTPGNTHELSQALDAMMTDTDMRRRMGINGRLRLEKEFSIQSHNQQLLNLYQSFL
ncbi:glycosyltransferase family 4 protein [Desulfomicrobium escambiense]|uniref:glycosyltransferase family 4 protein n=1 Tax=Desulfomicrobium escambiense TaxID=29503 RepID=UPI0003F8D9F3|nr:glycosyltransferase family 4 protein [Desulfomicrobium escambiense]